MQAKRSLSPIEQSSWFGVATIAVTLIAGSALRCAHFDYSLWFDDLASLFYASQPLKNLWSDWIMRETTPPLFYAALHVWTDLFGWSPAAVRSLPILSGLLIIPIWYYAMVRNHRPLAAAGTALLLAVSPQQLVFSHQVRAYILLYLAVAVSYFGLLDVLRKDGRRWFGWSVYVAGAVVAIYLHTTALLWPAAATLALLATDKRFRPFTGVRHYDVVLASSAILVASAWWLRIVVLQTTKLNGNIGWISPPVLKDLPRFLLDTTFLARPEAPYGLAAASTVAALAVYGAYQTWGDPRTRFTVLCYGLAVSLFVLVSQKQPIILDRTVLWLSIFPLALVAAALADRQMWKVITGLTMIVVVLQGTSAAMIVHTLEREDWRTPVTTMARVPPAVIIVDGEAMSVAMTMACRAELGRVACPFSIVSLIVPGKMMDRWADGYARNPRLNGLQWDDLRQPRVYTFSRWAHDPLDELHKQCLLLTTYNQPSSFAGPLPPTALANLARKFGLQDGLIHLASHKVRSPPDGCSNAHEEAQRPAS